jgi:replicative DNA helicase
MAAATATDVVGPDLDWASLGVPGDPWPEIPGADLPAEPLVLGRPDPMTPPAGLTATPWSPSGPDLAPQPAPVADRPRPAAPPPPMMQPGSAPAALQPRPSAPPPAPQTMAAPQPMAAPMPPGFPPADVVPPAATLRPLAAPAPAAPASAAATPPPALLRPTPPPAPAPAPAMAPPVPSALAPSLAPVAPPPAQPAPASAPRPKAAADPTTWAVETNTAIVTPRSATEVLSTLAQKVAVGNVDQYQPVPLGFTPLDKTIGGGLRAGELLLIGGAQGTGKTTMAVQMARNIVLGGQASVLYICFEHDEEYLLNRIIAMESALDQLPAKTSGVKLTDVRKEILGTWLAQGNENADLSANPRLRPALERINRYGQNLFLLRGSQTTSTVENIRQLVERYKQISGDKRLVVFIDYMQKVPVIPDPPTETEKVTYVVNGLKDVALSNDVPMISIVAADKEGLKAARLRNHHLRGSSAINYEADIILILNEKYSIVSKVNIEFNPYQAQRFRDWVIMTVEKNRGGQNAVDLEYEKHFEFSCFDSNGRTVQEKLIEERLYND